MSFFGFNCVIFLFNCVIFFVQLCQVWVQLFRLGVKDRIAFFILYGSTGKAQIRGKDAANIDQRSKTLLHVR